VTGHKLRVEDLDRLLREALPDSPEAGEEERLRPVLRRAWAEARAAGGSEERPVSLAGTWALQAALGAAAGLAIALGLALHLAFPPRLVADGLAAQASSLRALAQLRRAVAMECVLDAVDGVGRPRRYHVTWRAPDEARVRLDGPGGATWLVRVPASRTGLIAPRRGSGPDDPRLAPARDVLSPDRVAGLLDARRGVRVTLDGATGLPVRMEAGFSATCDFDLEEPPPPPLVGAAGRGR